MKIISKRLPASMIKKLVIPSIGVLAFVIFSSLILFETTKAKVGLTQDGEKQTVKTHLNTVEELLSELEVVVGEHDLLSHDMSTKLENGMEIKHERAKHVIVTIDGIDQDFYTTTDNIDAFLSDENLTFSTHDELSFDITDEIVEGLSINITTAYQVTIDDGGKEQVVWTTGGTIEELLDTNEIILNKKIDKIKPALDKTPKKDALITITRVEVEEDSIEESIAFETEKKEDDSLAKGEEKVISEGKAGVVVKTYEITLENGEEVDRKLVTEEVEEETENRIVAIGTKEPEPEQELVTLANKTKTKSEKKTETEIETKTDSDASTNDSSEKVLYMNATAYSAECNGCSGITATGINLNANPDMKVIAVDPNVIPLGTKVWVEGYGNAVAGDTGGSISGNRIDVHLPTSADASKFGWKKVQVKVLE